MCSPVAVLSSFFATVLRQKLYAVPVELRFRNTCWYPTVALYTEYQRVEPVELLVDQKINDPALVAPSVCT